MEKDIKTVGDVVSGAAGDAPATFRLLWRNAGLQAVRNAGGARLKRLAASLLEGKCAWQKLTEERLSALSAPKEGEPPMEAADALNLRTDLLAFDEDVMKANTAQRDKLRSAHDTCNVAIGSPAAEQCPGLRAALVAALSADYALAFRNSGWAKDHIKAKILMGAPCRLLGSGADAYKVNFDVKANGAMVPSATKTTKDASQSAFSMMFPAMGTGLKLSLRVS